MIGGGGDFKALSDEFCGEAVNNNGADDDDEGVGDEKFAAGDLRAAKAQSEYG